MVDREDASALGCLGYVARASGMPTARRLDPPDYLLPSTRSAPTTGDVLAADGPGDEFAASTALAGDLIEQQRPEITIAATAARGTRSGVGIVEGSARHYVHRVEIDAGPGSRRSKIVDRSWFNWPAPPVAMADTIVPDFPGV